ncbi:MAG: hypothetical protein J0M12_14135, partial [Deltaproteobacteria bacterium]|nr:hypothetical protein [Deltaproteobacteria bacterium]
KETFRIHTNVVFVLSRTELLQREILLRRKVEEEALSTWGPHSGSWTAAAATASVHAAPSPLDRFLHRRGAMHRTNLHAEEDNEEQLLQEAQKAARYLQQVADGDTSYWGSLMSLPRGPTAELQIASEKISWFQAMDYFQQVEASTGNQPELFSVCTWYDFEAEMSGVGTVAESHRLRLLKHQTLSSVCTNNQSPALALLHGHFDVCAASRAAWFEILRQELCEREEILRAKLTRKAFAGTMLGDDEGELSEDNDAETEDGKRTSKSRSIEHVDSNESFDEATNIERNWNKMAADICKGNPLLRNSLLTRITLPEREARHSIAVAFVTEAENILRTAMQNTEHSEWSVELLCDFEQPHAYISTLRMPQHNEQFTLFATQIREEEELLRRTTLRLSEQQEYETQFLLVQSEEAQRIAIKEEMQSTVNKLCRLCLEEEEEIQRRYVRLEEVSLLQESSKEAHSFGNQIDLVSSKEPKERQRLSVEEEVLFVQIALEATVDVEGRTRKWQLEPFALAMLRELYHASREGGARTELYRREATVFHGLTAAALVDCEVASRATIHRVRQDQHSVLHLEYHCEQKRIAIEKDTISELHSLQRVELEDLCLISRGALQTTMCVRGQTVQRFLQDETGTGTHSPRHSACDIAFLDNGALLRTLFLDEPTSRTALHESSWTDLMRLQAECQQIAEQKQLIEATVHEKIVYRSQYWEERTASFARGVSDAEVLGRDEIRSMALGAALWLDLTKEEEYIRRWQAECCEHVVSLRALQRAAEYSRTRLVLEAEEHTARTYLTSMDTSLCVQERVTIFADFLLAQAARNQRNRVLTLYQPYLYNTLVLPGYVERPETSARTQLCEQEDAARQEYTRRAEQGELFAVELADTLCKEEPLSWTETFERDKSPAFKSFP